MGIYLITPRDARLKQIIQNALTSQNIMLITKQHFALPMLGISSEDSFTRWYFNIIQRELEAHTFDAFHDIAEIMEQRRIARNKPYLGVKDGTDPRLTTTMILAIRSTGTYSSFFIVPEIVGHLKAIETSHKIFIIEFKFKGDYWTNSKYFAKIQEVSDIDKELGEYIKLYQEIKPNTNN